MKKILFLSPHPEWGGSATANIMIAKMLGSCGYDVIYNDEYSELDFFNGVRIHHLPFHKNKQNRNRYLMEYVRENKISVVFWGLPQLFVFFIPSVWTLRKRGVVQLTIFHSLSLNSGIRSRISEWISAVSVGMMNYIVFVSKYTLHSWSKYYLFRKCQNKSHVIYNAITPQSTSHIMIDKKNLSIGFVGRFSREKQPELFCSLSDYYLGKCIAYGDGPLLEMCKLKYPKVDFRGVSKEQNVLYEGIDVLIMTSAFENCPMVILEAMSRGIPCVAPNVGGIPEIVVNGLNGILYDYFSVNDMLSAIEVIKNNYSQISRSCLDSAHNYYFSIIEKDWFSLLNKA